MDCLQFICRTNETYNAMLFWSSDMSDTLPLSYNILYNLVVIKKFCYAYKSLIEIIRSLTFFIQETKRCNSYTRTTTDEVFVI